MKKIIIAIDGLSATGKSTLAKQLAQKLNYTYIDSGAMYRAITYSFQQQQIQLQDTQKIKQALSNIQLSFTQNQIYLNETNIENKIRSMEVSNQVSEISALEQVRNFAVAQQQQMGIKKGIVMDGRDIGTTVFPQAELKIYLFANEEIRVHRRYMEFKEKNPDIHINTIRENLKHRDFIDTHREISPLQKANDAISLDNSHLSMEQQLEIAYNWALEKINTP